MLTLSTKLSHIRGINSRLLNGLKKLSIETVRDLIWHLPFRYDDFSQTVPIAELAVGQMATIQGRIQSIASRRTWRRHMILIEAIISDDSGSIKAIWFNQPYLLRTLTQGSIGNFAGKVVFSDNDMCISNPIYEPLGADIKHTAGLIPIYSETRGITSRGIRYLVKPILQELKIIPDSIPASVLRDARLPDLAAALRAIHFPHTIAHANLARRRIAFEELFLLQTVNLQTKMFLAKEPAIPLVCAPAERDTILATLPFTLTASQQHALHEILTDCAKPHPMNRLLQGDVGSGKTVVVGIASLIAARQEYQIALLAPTEVLAEQHYRTFMKLFGSIMNQWHINLALLTSAGARCFYGDDLETTLPKQRLVKQIADGYMKITIGTHALLQKSVVFPALALIVVDEQHRFGVAQRAALLKRNHIPHFLSMSATPIPRTLSLTVFGDLDISIIDELPSGRLPIITKIVAPANRSKAYQFIREQIKKGRQAFVICPRISETENQTSAIGRADWSDVKAVEKEYEKLSQEIFPDFIIGMLHGKLKSVEKSRVMKNFAENKIHLLVSTSVIEVGVDIPNATIMVIEDADRFGLAQLYQFRGRVGRNERQSFCLLFTESSSATAHRRLKSLLEAKNGFELAEKDLQIRGPGEFLGKSQTGMPDIAMKALTNMDLVKAARNAALRLLAADPTLEKHPLLHERLAAFQSAVHLE